MTTTGRDGPEQRVEEPSLDEVLSSRAVTPLFQPVVDLSDGEVVGYEALARGPHGSALEAPTALLSAAWEQGRLVELDWLCREQAVTAARQASLRHPLSLFVNAEPRVLGHAGLTDTQRWEAMGDLRCYAEVTGRALAASPGELLRAVDTVRSLDWGVSLDDVGRHPEALGLLPLLQPDIIKLDSSLFERSPDLGVTRTLYAVLEQAEATGAALVAEGVDSAEKLDRVRSWGVRYAQGYTLGRPSELPETLAYPTLPLPLVPRLVDRSVVPGPYAIITQHQRAQRLSWQRVRELFGALLLQAESLAPAPIVLLAVPSAELLDADLRERLTALAHRLPLVAAFGPGTLGSVMPGVRTGPLEEGDPCALDWDLIVVNSNAAEAVVSRTTGPGTAGRGSDFLAVLSVERPPVSSAANALLTRLPALGRL